MPPLQQQRDCCPCPRMLGCCGHQARRYVGGVPLLLLERDGQRQEQQASHWAPIPQSPALFHHYCGSVSTPFHRPNYCLRPPPLKPARPCCCCYAACWTVTAATPSHTSRPGRAPAAARPRLLLTFDAFDGAVQTAPPRSSLAPLAASSQALLTQNRILKGPLPVQVARSRCYWRVARYSWTHPCCCRAHCLLATPQRGRHDASFAHINAASAA